MWWGNKKSNNDEEGSSSPANPDNKVFLEDLPPKFEDETVSAKKEISESLRQQHADQMFEKAFTSIKATDFKHVNSIPCFRQGMLAGIGMGGVVAAVMITMRQPLSKGLNWGMAGFLLGSVVSWEQCRYKIRVERRNTEMAKRMYREKDSQQTTEQPSK